MVDSNVKFDESLKSRDPEWGIRELEKVGETAQLNGIVVEDYVKMPTNNLFVIFRKI